MYKNDEKKRKLADGKSKNNTATVIPYGRFYSMAVESVKDRKTNAHGPDTFCDISSWKELKKCKRKEDKMQKQK